MTTLATESDVAVAVLAAVNASLATLATSRTAYSVDKLPSVRPSEYVEVGVTRRFGGQQRVGGAWIGTVAWRATFRYVSQSSMTNARLMRERVRAALEFVELDGVDSTPWQFETAEDIGPDDGWFSGLDSYTTTT
ncbi:MAG TPA: hypothetical protein VFL94_02100 [Actinomycetales bacterium]|nr:hypothetical protein [Actinomycetales bacterium]